MFSTPDILVVGPFKTGTTWLYRQLKETDSIKRPTFKEVSFLYDADLDRKLKLLKKEKPIAEKTDKASKRANFLATRTVEELILNRKAVIKKNFRQIWKWGEVKANLYLSAIYFYIIPRSFNYISLYLYTLLFRKKKGQVAVDISPSYFKLSCEAIEIIKTQFPKIKVVFILRDPVEREWSQIRMNYYKKENAPIFSVKEYLKLPHPDNDYKSAINNWEKYFGKDEILYLFYDDLVANKEKFVGTFMDFATRNWTMRNIVNEKVGKGIDLDMGNEIREGLTAAYMGQYEFLAEKFGPASPAGTWLKNAWQIAIKGQLQ